MVTETEPQVVVLFGKSEFGDNREVWKAFVNQYALPRSCCSWGTVEAKRSMPAPRRLRWVASDVIDAEVDSAAASVAETRHLSEPY